MKACARRLLVIASMLITMTVTTQTAGAATITVAPNTPDVGNCFPFGIGLDPDDPWPPHAAFFYRNVPAFELSPGDTLAFDLGAQNDADVGLDIALARTTTNGGTVEGEAFQTLVTNTQVPANPRGDTTIGNFELRFAVQAPFSFPGGGLIIRFSNPSAAHLADDTCTEVVVGAQSTDTSGFFVQRAFADADGVSPWDQQMPESIGGFQVTTPDPPPPPPPADTDPPETTITKGAPARTDKTHVKFKFVSDEASSRFECKLDKRPYRSCTSPKKLKRLADKRHRFKVRAIDPAGNVDPTAAKDKFKVVD